jgi:Cu-Zn family superoxide dismutase
MSTKSLLSFVGSIGLLSAAPASAAPGESGKPITVSVNLVSADGVGKSVGTINIRPGKDGVVLLPKLKDLPPGEHGFHLHENPSCDPGMKDGKKSAAEAAGGHFDPGATKAHKGPEGGGHKGDLPKLVVAQNGAATQKMEVKGMALADFHGKTLMIHAGGDNYSDAPKPLGGGGERIACGVVK